MTPTPRDVGSYDKSNASAGPLADAWLSVQWADQKIENLTRSIKTFFETKPYTHVVDRKSHLGYEIHKLAFNRVPPVDLKRLVKEISQDLRAPLDYSIGVVATNNPRAGIDPDNLSFPIARKGAEAFETLLRKGKIAEFSPALADLIRKMRPYDPADGGTNSLFGLHKINRSEKHVRLSIVGSVGAPKTFTFYSAPEIIHIPNEPWQDSKDGIVLFSTVDGSNPQCTVDSVLNIAISKPDVWERQPVAPIFQTISHNIKRYLRTIENDIL